MRRVNGRCVALQGAASDLQRRASTPARSCRGLPGTAVEPFRCKPPKYPSSRSMPTDVYAARAALPVQAIHESAASRLCARLSMLPPLKKHTISARKRS
jgi:hypothetical protein